MDPLDPAPLVVNAAVQNGPAAAGLVNVAAAGEADNNANVNAGLNQAIPLGNAAVSS